MCRILLVRSKTPFAIAKELKPFASIAENSREYQGHGWGCSWLPVSDVPVFDEPVSDSPLSDSNGTSTEDEPQRWQHYHNIKPIWQDDPDQFATTTLLLVHARSAFRDEGIAVENNMPFSDGESVFIFNGELRGVKIKSEGRIGAEKIFNYIRRMDKGDKLQALEKAVAIINRRTQYVRAMNILMSDGDQCLVSSTYNEDPGYFQMHRSVHNGIERVCSEPYPLAGDPVIAGTEIAETAIAETEIAEAVYAKTNNAVAGVVDQWDVIANETTAVI